MDDFAVPHCLCAFFMIFSSLATSEKNFSSISITIGVRVWTMARPNNQNDTEVKGLDPTISEKRKSLNIN